MMVLERRDGLFFVVIFFGLLVRLALAPPIWHHGEAREALVVQGIVRNHEWILPLVDGSSNPAGGSVFCVLLPLSR
jgi:hypothetical protein